jgi:hypothetical protein
LAGRGRCPVLLGGLIKIAEWSAVPVLLVVMASFDPEVAHLPFDHTRISAVATFRIDLVDHFAEQEQIVIIVMGEGEKTPVSRSWTG